MNMRTMLMTVLTVAGVIAAPGFPAQAADAHSTKASPNAGTKALAEKPKAESAALKEVTLTGSIKRQEMRIAGQMRAVFTLVSAAGERIHLPSASQVAKATKTSAIQLADYVGQNVKVIALAREQQKGGKTVVKIRTIKSIEKVAAVPSSVGRRAA